MYAKHIYRWSVMLYTECTVYVQGFCCMYDVFHVENVSTSDTLCIRFLDKMYSSTNIFLFFDFQGLFRIPAFTLLDDCTCEWKKGLATFALLSTAPKLSQYNDFFKSYIKVIDKSYWSITFCMFKQKYIYDWCKVHIFMVSNSFLCWINTWTASIIH